MRHRLHAVAALLLTGCVLAIPGSASAAEIPLPDLPDLPLPGAPSVPGFSDCKEAPTPESPGQGIAGFFSGPPVQLPAQGDPFAAGSTTTIYEQYGYAGLRYRTYDLGCGPDAMRNPDAVIGTAVSNWLMQPTLAFSALTGSLTSASFQPTFLGGFDPVVEGVSDGLHRGLFQSWIPAVIAVLGAILVFTARRSSLSTTAGAIGWALIIGILATALFRWPVEAGNAADQTVTSTIGAVVGRLDGDRNGTDPGTAVNSHVTESILYRAWLAGTFGSSDSPTARRYGPGLFKAQALTWSEARAARSDPERAEEIYTAKNEEWTGVAAQVQRADPEAYEHLTGMRSETRVGYALVSGLGVFLALPFLLLSALLMLGCFLIVRLAVMVFPAFAVLGIFPATRGLVTGLVRTVAAAVVNAIVFGIGAGVTVAVLGILFNPGGGAPAWLSLVLMPLFTVVMWVALKPFRRLTSMVSPTDRHMQSMANPFAGAGRASRRMIGRAGTLVMAAASGGTAGAATATAAAAAGRDSDETDEAPLRAEAQPTSTHPPALPSGSGARHHSNEQQAPHAAAEGDSRPAEAASTRTEQQSPTVPTPRPTPTYETPSDADAPRALPEGFVPKPQAEAVPPPPPAGSEWYDGEEVYTIYRPDQDGDDDAA